MSQAIRMAALVAVTLSSLSGGAALAAGAAASPARVAAMESRTPMVGGAPMYPDRTIVENASTAKNLKTLVAAVKEAGLVETLSGSGPFTVFAPTDDAFAKLPKAAVADLMKPENRQKLTKLLTYHVVPGEITAKTLAADIKKGGGKASFTTVEGKKLTVEERKGHFVVKDAAGHTSRIQQTDVMQSNGVVFVIGSVLMPS